MSDYPFTIRESILNDLKAAAKRISNPRKKKDVVIIYGGNEGTGKTTLAIQHCYVISKLAGTKFGIDNIYFDPNKLYEDITNTRHPPGSVILFDEGVTGLLAKMGTSKLGVKLQIMLNTCRSKRYALLICIPRAYELPEWLIKHRSHGLYKTFEYQSTGGQGSRNAFIGFPPVSKELWYNLIKRKKSEEANKVKTTLPVNFSPWPFGTTSINTPFTEEQYESKKLTQMASGLEDKPKTREDKYKTQRNIAVAQIINNHILKPKEFAQLMGCSEREVRRMAENGANSLENTGF